MPNNLPDNQWARLLVALIEAEVDFVVCGGVAVILHGISRVTADLDVCVRLTDDNLRHVVDVARRLSLRPRVTEPIENLVDAQRRRAWIEEKGARVFTLVSSDGMLQVDLFLQYPIAYDALAANAVIADMGTHRFMVSSREHLIEAKRAVQPPRKQDLRDIEDLMGLSDREQSD